MTREEAIDFNKNLRMYMRLSDKNQPYKFLEENYIALDMAIKALEEKKIKPCTEEYRRVYMQGWTEGRKKLVDAMEREIAI